MEKGQWGTYGVEAEPPSLVQKGIVAPESRCAVIRALREHERSDDADEVESEAGPSTAARRDGMRDGEADDLGQDIATVVDEERGPADLADHVLVAIQDRRAHNF